MLFAIKDALVNFFVNPWTVVGSSDGVNSSMDGTDRWVNSGDVVYPTNSLDPHSWIVLQQTAIGATFQIILATDKTLADDPGRDDVTILANQTGFGVASGGSDGATNSKPTAGTPGRNFGVDGTDWIGANGAVAKVLTCISSTDGQCTRIIVSNQSTGIPVTGLGFEVPRLPPIGTTSLMYLFKSTVASGLSCFRWETMSNAVTNGEMAANVAANAGGFVSITLVPEIPLFNSIEVIDLQEDDRPNPMLYPCVLYGTLAGTQDSTLHHGTLFDWYWCSRNPAGKHLLDLDTIPLAGNRTFVCVGDPVIGWLDDSATDLSYT